MSQFIGGAKLTDAGDMHVMVGASGQPRVREKNAVAGTRVDFTFSPGITEAKFKIVPEAVTTLEINSIAVAIDPPSDVVADAWLVSTNSGTLDSQRVLIKAKQDSETFYFTSPVTRLSVIRYLGSDAMTVSIEAV